MTLRHHRRLPFGAELIAPDRTRFRLWAPSCPRVSLAIEGRDDIAMLAAGEGWFEVDADCIAGTRYRFRIVPEDRGDALLVPDPASRAQVDDVHGASVVIDPESYRWVHDDWRGRAWCEAVIYEIHVGVADGFKGVQRLLPELAELGITAIELMPVAEFAGSRDWGYDGVLPFAPEATYGTPDDLKALIDAAHGCGLMVFLDVVYNHFGPEGNYIGAYADAFFRDDIKTPWGRAIDFRKPEVRDFFRNNALYWLMEYRIDGLRLDATHSIVPQDWLKTLSAFVLDTVDASRHVHLMIEHEGNAAHLLGPCYGPDHGPKRGPKRGYEAQWNDDGHHVLHVLLTGETDGYYVDFADAPADKLARCLAEGFVYQGQPSIFLNGVARGEPSKELPPTAFILFLQNHDQIGNRAFGQRLTMLADPAALKVASALVLLSPQIPLLFMGEEWGAIEPFLYFTSFPDEKLAAAVRDGRRNEFSGARGYARDDVDTEDADAIPDPNDASTFERSRLDFDRATREAISDAPTIASSSAWLAHTRRLLAIRHRHIVPRLEGTRSLGAEAVGPSAVVARWHMGDGAVLAIAVNLGALPVAVPAHRFHMRGDVIFTTRKDAHPDPDGNLPGHTIWVLLEGAT